MHRPLSVTGQRCSSLEQVCTGYINVWRNEDHGQPFIHSETHYSLQQAEAERTVSRKGYKKTLIARLPFQYNFPDMTKVETNWLKLM